MNLTPLSYTPNPDPPKQGDELIFAIKKSDMSLDLANTCSVYSPKEVALKGDTGLYPSLQALVPGLDLDRYPESVSEDEVVPQHFFEWRSILEADDSPYVHFIPYLVITKPGEDGEFLVYTYQRTKLVGEQQLSGNYSNGIGGHPSFPYETLPRSRKQSLNELIAQGLYNEYMEEVALSLGGSESDEQRLQTSSFDHVKHLGFIYDVSNTVGKRHLGVLYHLHLPNPDTKVWVKEKELRDCGFLSLDTLRGLRDEGTLENWSSIATQILEQNFSLKVETIVD